MSKTFIGLNSLIDFNSGETIMWDNGEWITTTPNILLGSEYYTSSQTNNIFVTTGTTQFISGKKTFTDVVNIISDLYVSGVTTFVNTENLNISDNLICINSGETGAGVTKLTSGINVDRGTETNYYFVFDENSDTFRVGASDAIETINIVTSGDTQAVATREDIPTASAISYWNEEDNKFITNSNLLFDGTSMNVKSKINLSPYDNTTITTGDLWYNENGDSLYFASGTTNIDILAYSKIEINDIYVSNESQLNDAINEHKINSKGSRIWVTNDITLTADRDWHIHPQDDPKLEIIGINNILINLNTYKLTLGGAFYKNFRFYRNGNELPFIYVYQGVFDGDNIGFLYDMDYGASGDTHLTHFEITGNSYINGTGRISINNIQHVSGDDPYLNTNEYLQPIIINNSIDNGTPPLLYITIKNFNSKSSFLRYSRVLLTTSYLIRIIVTGDETWYYYNTQELPGQGNIDSNSNIKKISTIDDLYFGLTRTGNTYDFLGVNSDNFIVKTKENKPFIELTSGSTTNWDLNNGKNAKVTISGDITLEISGATDGMYGTIKITQDPSGSHSLTLGSGTHKVVNGGSGDIILSTGPNDEDILSFVYTDDTFYWNAGYNYTS